MPLNPRILNLADNGFWQPWPGACCVLCQLIFSNSFVHQYVYPFNNGKAHIYIRYAYILLAILNLADNGFWQPWPGACCVLCQLIFSNSFVHQYVYPFNNGKAHIYIRYAYILLASIYLMGEYISLAFPPILLCFGSM